MKCSEEEWKEKAQNNMLLYRIYHLKLYKNYKKGIVKMKERLLRVLTLIYTCKTRLATSILHFIQRIEIHYVNYKTYQYQRMLEACFSFINHLKSQYKDHCLEVPKLRPLPSSCLCLYICHLIWLPNDYDQF